MDSVLRNMGREMDELRNVVKEKAVENLHEMIQTTISLFTTEVLSCPLAKVSPLQLDSYDSSRDSLDHIESFKTLMHLQMTLDEVMCGDF